MKRALMILAFGILISCSNDDGGDDCACETYYASNNQGISFEVPILLKPCRTPEGSFDIDENGRRTLGLLSERSARQLSFEQGCIDNP